MDAQIHGKKYLESQIRTASKEQLLLMLYDGAIHNCLSAIDFLQHEDTEKACEKLIKAQNIVAELLSCLQFDKNETVSKNLASLYGYVYVQLMEANIKHNIQAIDNCLKILNPLKETWQQAFEQIENHQNEATRTTDTQEAKPLIRSGLSIQA